MNAFKNYLFLFGIALIWGSQFILNAVALKSMNPFELATGRSILGAFTLCVLSFTIFKLSWKEQWKEFKKSWKLFFLVSLCEAVIPFFLMGFGQTKVNPGLTAMILGSVPLFTLLFSILFFKAEKWSFPAFISFILGLFGLYFLVAFGEDFSSLLKNALGEIALLVAAMSFGLSIVLIKKLPSVSPITTVRNVLILASLELIVLGFLFDHHLNMNLTWPSFFSVIFSGIFATGVVYLMYLLVIHRAGPTFASFCNYLVPLVGVALDFAFVRSPIYSHEWVGMLLIIAALIIYQVPLKRKMDRFRTK